MIVVSFVFTILKLEFILQFSVFIRQFLYFLFSFNKLLNNKIVCFGAYDLITSFSFMILFSELTILTIFLSFCFFIMEVLQSSLRSHMPHSNSSVWLLLIYTFDWRLDLCLMSIERLNMHLLCLYLILRDICCKW